MRELSFGFSPCPNDTFAFHALVHGLVEAPFRVRPVLLDIEELNQRAKLAELDLTKVSVGALAAVTGEYEILRSGGALGYGAGPLVVAREPISLAQAVSGRIAIPGRDTTAFMLLGLLAPESAGAEVVELRFDRILDAVASGEVDAGLIIHESRFTYRDRGLVSVADLGELWEAETSLPVPLATICARRSLPAGVRAAAEQAVRASVEHAFADPAASLEYVRANSQELSDEVCRQHIELYVNRFSVDLGDEGTSAIQALVDRGAAARAG